jgi:Spy/CpxP family protein refolding chaperone
MTATRRRIRSALRRVNLTDQQAQLVRLLLREERRDRETTERQLADCRRNLHGALAPPAPDSAAVLELSVRERILLERQRSLASSLEQRIAAILGPERARELRTHAPVAHASATMASPRVGTQSFASQTPINAG